MGVVVIPRVIFRLMASASRRTVPHLRGCGMRRRLPRPFVLACSRKAHPLGSSAEADDYNSTYPRSRFHGLGCPRSFDSLAPGSARPIGSRNCGIYPGLSQGPVLPSPSTKFLRRFHQSNHGNGISHFSRTAEYLHPEIEGDEDHKQSGDLTDPDRWNQQGAGAGADQSPGEHR